MANELAMAIHKLKWSAEGGIWSANLRPDECRALLAHLEDQKSPSPRASIEVEPLETKWGFHGEDDEHYERT